LLSLAASAEAELVSSDIALPEEAAGKLRSAAGKARLLTSQKMQQFEGLCQKNIVRNFFPFFASSFIYLINGTSINKIYFRIRCRVKNFQRQTRTWLDSGIW